MSSPSYGPMYPRTAQLLSLVGGLVIAVFGLAEVGVGIFLRSTLGSFLPGRSGMSIGLGALAIVSGLGIVLMAGRLKSSPQSARTSGIVIVALALMGFFGGGGLFLGLLLAVVGGLLAMTWNPPVLPQSVFSSSGYSLKADQPVATMEWGPPSSPSSRLGGAGRVCPSCGARNVADARFCAACGAPVR